MGSDGLRARSWCATSRTDLIQHRWPLTGLSILSNIVFEIVWQVLDAASTPTSIARVLCAMSTLAMAASWWSCMDGRVVYLLLGRARYARMRMQEAHAARTLFCDSVVYFIGACIVSEVLTFVMRWGHTEPLSEALLSSAGLACFIIVPLSDSLDRTHFSVRFVRVAALLGVLVKGTGGSTTTYQSSQYHDSDWHAGTWLVSCKASPKQCHSSLHDCRWEVSSSTSANLTHATTANATIAHNLLSTLDVKNTCDMMSTKSCMNPTARLHAFAE